MVFYRLYRPQTLDELIGQTFIKQTLQKAYDAKRLSHAYLFCGPRGTGKTSTARILAKMVNCEGQKIPCNSCVSCLSITDGSNLDLIEIDAASNRGIDDIRELRDKIKLAPTSSLKKVYIIDEVHMLTNEAFNALLKTLEEPPSHVLFILATTDPQKIPQTILSRVQRLDFSLATIEELIEALKRVVKSEKLEVDDASLNLIAKKAEGSFRDCLKFLDQLASSGEKITLEMVENSLRSAKFTDNFNLLQSIQKQDPISCLEIIKTQIDNGVNIKDFLNSLMDILRAMMFLKHGAKKTIEAEYQKEKYQQLIALTNQFSAEKLIKIINLFQEAVEKTKYSSIPSLPLEVAAVEACMNYSTSVKEVHLMEENKQQQAPEIIPEQIVVEATTQKDDITSTDLLRLLDKWTYVLETIKPYNYSLEALLRQVKISSCNEGVLLLEVPYTFHQRILETPKSRDLLESVVSDVLSKSVKVKTVLGKKPLKVEELANIELAADDEIIKVAAEIFNS